MLNKDLLRIIIFLKKLKKNNYLAYQLFVKIKMEKRDFEFSLSINNLKSIPFHMYANDFTFHVNNKSYKTNRFIADLLSPNIRRLHYSDQSINEYTISSKSSINEEGDDSFQQFLKLATFEKFKINEKLQQKHHRQ